MTPENHPGITVRAADVADAVERIRVALFAAPNAVPASVAGNGAAPSPSSLPKAA